jgi:hypothetical protein
VSVPIHGTLRSALFEFECEVLNHVTGRRRPYPIHAAGSVRRKLPGSSHCTNNTGYAGVKQRGRSGRIGVRTDAVLAASQAVQSHRNPTSNLKVCLAVLFCACNLLHMPKIYSGRSYKGCCYPSCRARQTLQAPRRHVLHSTARTCCRHSASSRTKQCAGSTLCASPHRNSSCCLFTTTASSTPVQQDVSVAPVASIRCFQLKFDDSFSMSWGFLVRCSHGCGALSVGHISSRHPLG